MKRQLQKEIQTTRFGSLIYIKLCQNLGRGLILVLPGIKLVIVTLLFQQLRMGSLLHDLPLNLVGSFFYQTHIHGQPIVGNIILMKDGYRDGERDIVGLEEDEAEKLLDMVLKLPFGVVRGEEKA